MLHVHVLLSFLGGYFSSYKKIMRQREICKKSWNQEKSLLKLTRNDFTFLNMTSDKNISRLMPSSDFHKNEERFVNMWMLQIILIKSIKKIDLFAGILMWKRIMAVNYIKTYNKCHVFFKMTACQLEVFRLIV